MILATFDIPFLGQIMFVLIISGFMPLTAISFFRYMIPKKEKDYDKAMKDMGINTTKKVRDIYTPFRYFLPITFVSGICLLASIYIAFATSFVDNLNDSLFLTGAFFGEENIGLVSTKFIRINLCIFRRFYLVGY